MSARRESNFGSSPRAGASPPSLFVSRYVSPVSIRFLTFKKPLSMGRRQTLSLTADGISGTHRAP